MTNPLFGFWDGKKIDMRAMGEAEDPNVAPILSGLEEFDSANPIKAFIADRGFLVFDGQTDLAAAFHQYMSQAAQESCGKCTPCRVGTQQISDLLAKLRQARNLNAELADIVAMAEHMAETSLCGLGQSSGRGLAAAIKHFPNAFGRAEITHGLQHSYTYVTAPCIEACPAKLDVPAYIDCLKDGKPDHALGVVLDKYPMAASCGRVCVRFCESACRRANADGAVGIKMLKRFVADQVSEGGREIVLKKPQAQAEAGNKRIAIVGAGPAGVTCAYHLLLSGFKVDVYEAGQAAGGMALVGIPSYRLPKDVLKAETEDVILSLGGTIHYGQKLGKDYSVNALVKQGYDSVFLGFGASRGILLGVDNEAPGLSGYAAGVDFLLDVHNHVEHGKQMSLQGEVVVVGGGNVAMDCVRSALRMGASKVHLIYRRTREDMPADHEEIDAAEHEGVEFHFLSNPSHLIIENDIVVGVELLQMCQTERDARGRIGVEAVPGSEHALRCDLVIAAIGQQIDREVLCAEDGIVTDRWGCIQVDADTLQTSRDKVFAGGDCVLGPLTLIHAMDHGAKAAVSIRDYLLKGRTQISPEARMQKLLAKNRLLRSDKPTIAPIRIDRARVPELDAMERVKNFEEVEQGISKNAAYREAERCLRCYRVYSMVTRYPLAADMAASLQPSQHAV